MKRLNLFRLGAIALAMATLTACSDDEDNDNETTITLTAANATYNADGYWADCYDTSMPPLVLDGFTLSHTATDWGGGIMSWNGFCPSKATDTADYTTEGSWTQHQWCSITGYGVSEPTYIVAFWNASESTATVPETPALSITFDGGKKFTPVSIDITNNTYGYYSMKHGSAFNKAFTADDWCKVIIIGYDRASNRETGRTETYLARNGQLLDTWRNVSLSPLGEVDEIYFQMESSDSGQWGMNNAAYFCIDGLKIESK
ncbi:MAG: DUF4465 domain-containing protein [Pseudoflavonifractor sp.]|nr:DUF4465 domain-containing protein [Pseudoflavonifractor sp.]